MHIEIQMYEGVKVQIHDFLALAPAGGEWVASHSGHFTPGKGPWYPLDRRLDDPYSWSGRHGEMKTSWPY
jgi:hypothetical protein